MDATSPMSADLQRQQDRKRKRKALLAGGVVLGLGAAVTLAAWSDDVFAGGQFGTGTFELQGNVYGDTTGYASYDTAGEAGSLSFEIAPLNMAPGDTVYAPISIATSELTTTGATVTLSGATTTTDEDNLPLFNALRYSVSTTADGGTCDADSFTTESTWHALTAVGTDPFTVGAGQDDPEHLCFAVTLPDTVTPDGLQGLKTAPVVWQFTGESISAS